MRKGTTMRTLTDRESVTRAEQDPRFQVDVLFAELVLRLRCPQGKRQLEGAAYASARDGGELIDARG